MRRKLRLSLGFGSGEVKVRRRRAYPKQLRLKICIPGQEGTRHTNIVSMAMLSVSASQLINKYRYFL
jgi:hypothetical protein